MKTLNSWGQNKMAFNLIEFLMSIPEFNTLSNDELEMLDKIMLVDHYPDGHKFKSDDNIYLIIDGDVAERYKKESGLLNHNHMHSGELFGLFSIIDHSMQTATCTAVGQVTAASLPRTAFELLFNSNLPLGHRFRHIVDLMHDADHSDNDYINENTSRSNQQYSYDFAVINSDLSQSCHAYNW